MIACATPRRAAPVDVVPADVVPAGFADAVRISSPQQLNYIRRKAPRLPADLHGVNTSSRVEVYVDENGSVVGTRHIEGNRSLSDAIADAAKSWQLAPLLADGKAVPFILPLTCTVYWAEHVVHVRMEITPAGR